MTIRELYAGIEGDYDQAMRVLRIEKLIDKHIRKLPANPIFDSLADAGKSMDANALFESGHAIKGVCANLGLTKLASLSSTVTEEFRPGNERKLSDEEVRRTLSEIDALYKKAVANIHEYEQAQ